MFFAISFCGQMIGNISSFIPDIVKARLAASLMFYLIEHPTEIDSLSPFGIRRVCPKENNRKGKLQKLIGELSLRNVYFNYPTRKHTKVLRGLNLEVQ